MSTTQASIHHATTGLVPDMAVIQATEFDDAEPRLELRDAAGTTLVSPIEGLLAIRRRREPGSPPVARLTTLAEAVSVWAEAIQKNLETTATADFDIFLLKRATEHLRLLDDLVTELDEVEGLDEQLTSETVARIRAKYPRWRMPNVMGTV